MNDEILDQLYKAGRAITFKKLKVTKTKLNPYEKLGLIKFLIIEDSGSKPKNVNAAELTTKGIEYITATSSKDVNPASELYQLKIELQQMKSTFTTAVTELSMGIRNINSLEKRIDALVGSLGTVEQPTITQTEPEPSQPKPPVKPGYQLTPQQAYLGYLAAKTPISDTVQIKAVIINLLQQTGQNKSILLNSLRNLHQLGFVELYQGRGDPKYSIEVDGTSYNLMKVQPQTA